MNDALETVMITIGMNYKVLPDKGETFTKAFNNVLGVMNDMEGHKESFMYQDVNDPNSYLIVSEWTSEDAFNDFIASDKFKQVVNWGKENILMGRPQHRTYQHSE
jgi:heme-degrading monooxygenase HmoA